MLNGITPHIVDVIIWTTTPWTLPANMALAVHPDVEYSVVRYPSWSSPHNDASGSLFHSSLEKLEASQSARDGGFNFSIDESSNGMIATLTKDSRLAIVATELIQSLSNL